MDNHLKVMMDCLNVAQIRSWLKQYNVLTTEEHDHLLNKFDDSSSRAAKETLINMLRTKGAKGLYHFMEALKDTADVLMEQGIMTYSVNFKRILM